LAIRLLILPNAYKENVIACLPTTLSIHATSIAENVPVLVALVSLLVAEIDSRDARFF